MEQENDVIVVHNRQVIRQSAMGMLRKTCLSTIDGRFREYRSDKLDCQEIEITSSGRGCHPHTTFHTTQGLLVEIMSNGKQLLGTVFHQNRKKTKTEAAKIV